MVVAKLVIPGTGIDQYRFQLVQGKALAARRCEFITFPHMFVRKINSHLTINGVTSVD